MDAAAAEAFWRELEEQDAERRARERLNELHDHVSSDLEPPTTFRIASVSPCFRTRLARTRKAEKSITETLGPGRPGLSALPS